MTGIRYSAWEKQYIRLICGHKPSRLRLRDGVGYCKACREWNWIDYVQTNDNIRAAEKRHSRGR